MILVLHGESYKRLAPPRNTKDRKRLQSSNDLGAVQAIAAVNRVNGQTTPVDHFMLTKRPRDRPTTKLAKPLATICDSAAVQRACGQDHIASPDMSRWYTRA